MYNDKANDYLSHYGILGMRWGVRRKTDSNGLVIKGKKGKVVDEKPKIDPAEETRQNNEKFRKELKELDPKAYQRVVNYEKAKGIDFIEKFTKDWDYDMDLIRDFTPRELESFLDEMNQADNVGDFLAHYGVLGMKWGVRRAVGPDGKVLRGSAARKYKKEQRISAKYEKKVSSLSDKELRERINRLNMEKQYEALTKRDMTKGESYVKGILATSGKTLATAFIIKQSPKVYAVVKSKMNSKLISLRRLDDTAEKLLKGF